jgi:predicted nucleotidyltransferase
MNKQQIIASIKAEKPYLQEHFGVEEIALFGSYARGEENADSDVDILVKMKIKTLGNYFSLLDYLEAKFRKKIDLVTKHTGLSERFVHLINKDIIYV